MFLVHYRHSQETVFLEVLGYIFLVIVHIYAHIVRAHYIHNPPAAVRYHQSAQRNNADKLTACILHITGIYRLCIHAHILYMLHGTFHRPFFFQTDVVRSHQASCTVVRIIKEGVYEASFVFRCFFEDLVHQIGRKFLQNIDFIVEVKFGDDVA